MFLNSLLRTSVASDWLSRAGGCRCWAKKGSPVVLATHSPLSWLWLQSDWVGHLRLPATAAPSDTTRPGCSGTANNEELQRAHLCYNKLLYEYPKLFHHFVTLTISGKGDMTVKKSPLGDPWLFKCSFWHSWGLAVAGVMRQRSARNPSRQGLAAQLPDRGEQASLGTVLRNGILQLHPFWSSETKVSRLHVNW